VGLVCWLVGVHWQQPATTRNCTIYIICLTWPPNRHWGASVLCLLGFASLANWAKAPER
jgi:phage terminase large subunit-like protein